MTPGLLLSATGLALAGLALSAFALLRHDARTRQRTQRMTEVIAPYSPAARPDAAAPAGRRVLVKTTFGPLVRIARVLGIEADRPDLYPVAPWLLLIPCLAGASVLTWVGTFLLGRPGWLAWPIAALVIARSVFGGFRGRYTAALYRQLPDALGMIVRAVRAGVPVTESFRTVARESAQPTATEFTRLCDELFIGMPMERALIDLATRTALKEYGFFAVALGLQRQTGGNLTEALDNLADVIRKRVRLRARAKALTSEARTSALVLASVPVVAGGALAAISPTYIRTLFADPMGTTVLGAAILSLAFGAATMRLIIQRTLR